uniref:Uncharacterized protein n=1 Tax=Meloidogyne enterolobii TaxID=390850 RepID=A0A6V7WNF5_MELEN|nr:unnamed protein product [Meloidogyne enterolobii]
MKRRKIFYKKLLLLTRMRHTPILGRKFFKHPVKMKLQSEKFILFFIIINQK